MIFTQFLAALALFASGFVSAIELGKGHCRKPCVGIDCLATLARISYEPKWCGAQLMEKLARRVILRPDVNWNYNPSFDTIDPCVYLTQQDPSLGVMLVNSLSNVTCSTISGIDAGSTDYSYPVHAAWSTNQVKFVNYNDSTWLGVPLYFRDGSVSVVVFNKPNSELPIICCENPDPRLTQCRRFF